MSERAWDCRIIRTTDGSLVMDVPEDLAKALRVTAGDELAVVKARNGFFEMWKPESTINPVELIERLNSIRRETLEEPPK